MALYKNLNIDEKKKIGSQLYADILQFKYKGNVLEFYTDLRKHVDMLDSYGYTEEKKVKNYCVFKGDVVKRIYKLT